MFVIFVKYYQYLIIFTKKNKGNTSEKDFQTFREHCLAHAFFMQKLDSFLWPPVKLRLLQLKPSNKPIFRKSKS